MNDFGYYIRKVEQKIIRGAEERMDESMVS
jgi:hypothetical protein